MKIAIIGAGNMGGAIARSLAQNILSADSGVAAGDSGVELWVANPSQGKLDALREQLAGCSGLHTTNDNQEAANGAGLVILCVKPWKMEEVIGGLRLDAGKQMVASVAAGITLATMEQWLCAASGQPSKMGGGQWTLFRIIPNTAIMVDESMTLVSSRGASREQEEFVTDLFVGMGAVVSIAEDKMDASTAIASCGIAFAMKYVRAAMQAGVELGLYPHDAKVLAAQAMKGAGEMLLAEGSHPEAEIDRVCTPGGMTIRGINELEHSGFNSAVIKALKACLNV